MLAIGLGALLFGAADGRGRAVRRRVPVRARRDGRARARGAAGGDVGVAGDRRAADGGRAGADQAAELGRDARLDDRRLHRQDRHAHRGRDDRRRPSVPGGARSTSPASATRPEGAIVDDGQPVQPGAAPAPLASLLLAAVHCNNARLVDDEERGWTILGDPDRGRPARAGTEGGARRRGGAAADAAPARDPVRLAAQADVGGRSGARRATASGRRVPRPRSCPAARGSPPTTASAR